MMWVSAKKSLPDLGVIVLIKGSKLQSMYRWEFPILLARRIENRHFKIGWSWVPINTTPPCNVAAPDVEFWSTF